MSTGTQAVNAWLVACAESFERHATELNALDRAIGDGDHGSNMQRGFAAARELQLDDTLTTAEAFRRIGMALVSSVGGASGPLFGTLFLRIGQNWSSPMSTAMMAQCLRAGGDAVSTRSRAQVGDATMVDGIMAVAQSLADSAARGVELGPALQSAAVAARDAAEATKEMVARRGRASTFGQASVGHMDPGARSVQLITESAAEYLA